ncbi:alkaline phosphatase family protein [Halobacterium bonnevillei]|uniref:Nucleotide pyrophosphatase n=1 Tax=Halobacterium bonnevillei TaxID=2692200 RepID=A0A6B0SEE2_9EURY|nr:alkaline phosphatase family protein [Halobacterium bonnevillei]MXR19086.1 nucleotide pyrophosphatase [Halobacterium bonnevillei]
MTTPQTVVVGLDGAHFELIQPWIAEGKLPNIERAIKSGIATDLESVLPPVTSPNWKAYSTGKNPGKLGIFWWENIDVEEQRVYYPSERKNLNATFWELVGETERVGIIGVPTTYPPKDVNGFLVSGAPDADRSGYTFPPSLEDELEEEYGYEVTKRNRLSVNRDVAVEEILDLIDSRFTVGKSLAEEYDVSFLQIATFYLNSLHHFLWDDEATLRGWQIIDDHIGDFLDDDTDLVLMSDHGSTEIETVFHVNSWLQQEGYLALNTGISEYLHRAGITQERMIRLAYLFRIPRLAERLTPNALIERLPDEEGGLSRKSKTDTVDWDSSIALASGQGLLYLMKDPDSDGYERIRSELIEKLEELQDPAGRSIATDIFRGEKIYSGPYLSEAPDIVIDQRQGVHITGGVGRDDVFDTPDTNKWKAENKRHGLFVASGPSFSESSPKKISILDLAPTLLHLHDCKIPEDMDGTVQKRIFARDSSPEQRNIEYRKRPELENEVDHIRRITRELNL